jgi:acyl-ACP thioesterase
MSILFTHEYHAQWTDMELNQHLANSAFLGYGRRFKLRNQFTTEAAGLCVTVDSVPRR